jgi:hypothetical protein
MRTIRQYQYQLRNGILPQLQACFAGGEVGAFVFVFFKGGYERNSIYATLVGPFRKTIHNVKALDRADPPNARNANPRQPHGYAIARIDPKGRGDELWEKI